jgi:hypothetical protein
VLCFFSFSFSFFFPSFSSRSFTFLDFFIHPLLAAPRCPLSPSGSVVTCAGTTQTPEVVRWTYAQHSPEALLAVLRFVNQMTEDTRRDPTLLARRLTYYTTQQTGNRNGVLIGSWNKETRDGTNPLAWRGSDQILRQYVNTGRSLRPSRSRACCRCVLPAAAVPVRVSV